MKRKRKAPVTANATPGVFKKSSKETARRIRAYHKLNKELTKCQKAGDQVGIQRVMRDMEALGGLDWYQKASQLGQSKQRGGDSSKWLIQSLKQLGLAQKVLEEDGTRRKLRLMDVGALYPDNYASYASFIDAVPMDLNPQSPEIIKQDLLELQPPDISSSTRDVRLNQYFDVLCLSLVVNFVGDPEDRGLMLQRTRSFLAPLTNPTQNSSPRLLFIVLPLPCITNSRYLDHHTFQQMLSSLGYHCLTYHHSNKLAYYLFQLRSPPIPTKWTKTLLKGKEGGSRNNFAIVIK